MGPLACDTHIHQRAGGGGMEEGTGQCGHRSMAQRELHHHIHTHSLRPGSMISPVIAGCVRVDSCVYTGSTALADPMPSAPGRRPHMRALPRRWSRWWTACVCCRKTPPNPGSSALKGMIGFPPTQRIVFIFCFCCWCLELRVFLLILFETSPRKLSLGQY